MIYLVAALYIIGALQMAAILDSGPYDTWPKRISLVALCAAWPVLFAGTFFLAMAKAHLAWLRGSK